ncbi:hypothetical protein LEMLEM_LOCUS18444 [Lemmus lemmus]
MSSLAISVSTRASSRSGAQTATAVFLDLTTCPYTAGVMTPCEYPRPQETCCTALLSVCAEVETMFASLTTTCPCDWG